MSLPVPESIKLLPAVFLTAFLAVTTVQTVTAQPPGSGSNSTESKANIIFDQTDKKSISGHVYIAHASGTRMKSPGNVGGGLIILKNAMLKYTKIDTEVYRRISLSSREIMKLPFVYIAFEGGFELTAAERDNLKSYLENGGFIMLEQFALGKEQSPVGSALSGMIRKALGSKARVSQLPNSHQLYHSYFDFPNGPPLGGELNYRKVGSNTIANRNYVSGKEVNYIEGITMNGRLVGICSSKRYLSKWLERNDPQLKFGINAIVFALTQKGGIVRR